MKYTDMLDAIDRHSQEILKVVLVNEKYNLPQFSVKLSASRRGDCIGYLNIYAKDEEQVRNIIKQRKYDYDDIDWCEEDCWDYEDIEIESISLLTDLE